MKKTFEEIALEIVKVYIDSKIKAATTNGGSYSIDHDYDVNSVYNMTNTIKTTADTLAQNYRNRIIEWDEQNFDREVEKMLDTTVENA